jgi:hypothetical protein
MVLVGCAEEVSLPTEYFGVVLHSCARRVGEVDWPGPQGGNFLIVQYETSRVFDRRFQLLSDRKAYTIVIKYDDVKVMVGDSHAARNSAVAFKVLPWQGVWHISCCIETYRS